MLWTITRKQILLNVLSYRFLVGFLLCQSLFVLAAALLVRDYEERVTAYGQAVSQSAKSLAEAKVFEEVSVTVHKPPSRLAAFCTGFDKTFGNQATVAYTVIPELKIGRQEKNPLLAALRSLDLVAVIQLVLGLLVLLFAHDAVSGERERGTLALSLAGPVPRHVFLLGQYLGGMLTVCAVFVVGILLAILFLIRSAVIDLATADWLRIGLIALLSLGYLSALYLLGIFISILSKRSSTALVLLLFFWIVFIVIFPNLTTALASQLKPVPARGLVTQQTSALVQEFWSRIESDSHGSLPMPTHRWEFIKDREVYSGDLPYPMRIYYAPREVMEWELEGLKRYLPLEIEYSERIHAVESDYQKRLEEQNSLAGTLARFSPAWSYYHAASAIAGTDAESYLTFLDGARRYRTQLVEYVKGKDGLYSYRYFTRLEPSRWKTNAELDLLKSQPGRLDQEIGRGWETVTPLQLSDLPPFHPAGASVADSVVKAVPDVLILVFLNLAFFLAAHVSFLKTDVRVGA